MVETQLYLWMKTLHVIFMVTWFSGLFYLPRLFVYHAMCQDQIGHERFLIMERKLYYGITYPGGILTTIFGLIMLHLNPTLLLKNRVILKLSLVAILWGYHLMCGHYYKKFRANDNKMSHVFFRFFNEFPVVILITVIYLVIVKPNL